MKNIIQEKLSKELSKKNLDLLLLINRDLSQIDPNFYYLTRAYKFENSTAILGKNSVLYVPEFEITRAERESSVKNIQKIPEKKFWEKIAEELKGKKVGINGNFLPLNLYKKLEKLKVKIDDFSKNLEEMRVIKTKDEILLIKKAVKKTMRVIKNLKHEKPENEIVADICYEFARKKMTPAFEPIVAFDADSTVPHFEVGSKVGGKCLLVDIGVFYKGYCSDITRTFLLRGVNSELKKIYEIVKEAQELAIEKIKPGVKARDVDKVAREHLQKNSFKLEHAAGHGIGIEIHEKPSISVKSEEILKEGMVFTVEPGIYLKGKYGVRIEDDVLVTKKGCEVLSR